MLHEKYKVIELKNHEYKDWLLKKHYARRLTNVSFCFGLIDNDYKLHGVCTFGSSANYHYNDGDCLFNTMKVRTLELNRLVINQTDEKNILSYFVSQCIKLLPKPTALVSYADPNNNHHGYIYQATNWLYTGESNPKTKFIFEDGSSYDMRRGLDKKGKIVEQVKLKPTLRYLYINADKREKKKLIKDLKVELKPYPKGQNGRYDCIDIDMTVQPDLFL